MRRALDTLGLRVNRLIRISYGPFQLGNLEKGTVEEVKLRILKEQVGHLIEIPDVKNVKESKTSDNKKFISNKRSQNPSSINHKSKKKLPVNRERLHVRAETSHKKANKNRKKN